MRWPLRYQFMLPMLGVMLGALVCVSLLNAYLAGRNSKQQIEQQLHEVTRTLSKSSFPLTTTVLKQMSGLTGAEFVYVKDRDDLMSSIKFSGELPPESKLQNADSFVLGNPIDFADQAYFHVVVDLKRHHSGDANTCLHILYPVQVYMKAWRQAFYPPLIIGAVVLFLVVLFASTISARVVRPMLRLQKQVGRIAEGDFRRIDLPGRDDEVRDLSESISRMAELLNSYEEDVRQHERLRTLGQLGSGIAHQIRNAATGCRLAIELHQRECRSGDDCDCLDIANRQVTLMEKQLKRFLSLGKQGVHPKKKFELADLVENTIPLLKPHADHVGVALHWSRPKEAYAIVGDSEAIEELIVNLLMNAIEAVSRNVADLGSQDEIGYVSIQLKRQKSDAISLEITDSGSGPADSVKKKLFTPFVSDKPDGTGLGLSVAQDIAKLHGGEIRWCRHQNETCFTVELPFVAREPQRAEVTCS